jgi:uncharacterized protein YciI
MAPDGVIDEAAATERVPEMHRYVLGLLRRVANRPVISQEQSDQIDSTHLAHLERLRHVGELLSYGPIEEESDLRAILLFRDGPVERVRPIAENDPAVLHGRLTVELFTWTGAAGLRIGPSPVPEPVDEP